MFCSTCGKGLNVGAHFCIYCGAPVEAGAAKINSHNRPTRSRRQVALWLLAAIVVLAGALAFWLRSYESTQVEIVGSTDPSHGTVLQQTLLQKLSCWIGLREQELTASVTPDEATFIFPTGNKGQYDWNVTGDVTRFQTQEYTWRVDIGDVVVDFSEMSKGPPQHGDLEALLAAGNVHAVRQFWSEGHTHVELASIAGVSIRRSCENVAILVSGKQSIADIFSARPQTVKFSILQPNKGWTSQDVSVTYKD